MQSKQKTILLLISLTSMFLVSGCLSGQEPVQVVVQPKPAETPPALQRQVAKRFQESASQGPTAVDSAIELSEKYAKLAEQASALRQQNQNLTTTNQRLKDQVVALEAQLQQAQKELTEANDLLIDMRIELNNWKADILGFRDEMRDAETAQLEALLKILKVLGGEAEAESTQAKDTSSTAAPLSEPGQPGPQKTPSSGESNE